MNIRKIDIFLSLMRTRSATSTALLSGISQPAVSQIIKQLERELGLTLFVLMNGRLTPTPEGEQIAREMSEISSAYRRMQGLVGNLRDDGQGILRIATLTYAHVFLPETIRQLQEIAPSVKVAITVKQAAEIVDTVSKAEADIGIVTDSADPQLARYKDLRGMDAIAVVPFDSDLADLSVISPSDLKGQRILSYDPESPFGEQASRAFASVGEQFEVSLHVASSTLLCALVEQGVGIALLEPFFILGPDRFKVRIKLFKPQIAMRPRLVFPANRPPSVLVQHFQRLFEANVRSMISRCKDA